MFNWLSVKQIRNSLTLGTIGSILTALPVCAAEKIYIIYGPLRLSLKVESLETFANEGVVNQELDFYLRSAGIKEEEYEEIQQVLLRKYNIDPIYLARFLNTPTGEQILERVGLLASLPGGSNGKYALRGAIIQAALDQENGLTIINFLNYLATDIQLNIAEIMQALEYIKRVSDATDGIIEDGAYLSSQNTSETSIDYATLPDIRQPGKYGVQPVRVIQLRDESRDRSFDVHIYQPQIWREGKTPVIIVSHGLGSRPQDFSELAQHLASYGYLVALPQHPGSDYYRLQSMFDGYSQSLYDIEEFIDRPLDITYILDEFDKRNNTEFEQQLNLDKVAVLGHSFGGYTALAVAGATFDWENVNIYCDRGVWEANPSMLLQCRALELSGQNYQFRDSRVQAIGIMNPVNSVVFGLNGLSKVKIPVLIGAGTNDPATPAIIEQIRALVWINTADKYLALMVGQAHFLTLPDIESQVATVVESVVDFETMDLEMIRLYGRTLTTAFLEFYLAGESEYQVYLQSAYGEYISNEPNPLYFLDDSAVLPLSETYNRFKPKEIPAIYP